LKYKAAAVTWGSLNSTKQEGNKKEILKEFLLEHQQQMQMWWQPMLKLSQEQLLPVFSGKHGNDWTIWEIEISAYLMEKGLDVCLDYEFEDRLPTKENKPLIWLLKYKITSTELLTWTRKLWVNSFKHS
jgi:hypothetical protein